MDTAASRPEGLDTFPKLLRHNAQALADRPASREKEFGIWQSWTWAEVEEETRALALGLMELGIQPGDRLAIIGSNRPRLYWSIVATQMAGGIPVPVYQDSVAEEMQYVLDHCGARFALAEDQEQVDKLLSVNDRLPGLEHIIYEDPRGLRNYDHSTLHPYSDLQNEGRATEARNGEELNRRIEAAKGSDTCIFLYTSGTTGKPKGVVLSNDNILMTSRASAEFDGLRASDSMLAYLPMAWVGDFIFSMGQAYISGMCVACPESAETVMHDLREIGPTYYFAPPRVFETMLTNVMIRMEDAGALKKKLFDHYLDFARRHGSRIAFSRHGPVYRVLVANLLAMLGAAEELAWNALRGIAFSIFDGIRGLFGHEGETPWKARSGLITTLGGAHVKYWAGHFLVYGPLKNTLGLSRIRVGYTAGEAIGPDLFEFYRSMGINLKQLYGQTEASVFITQHPDDAVILETVGVPTPGVEIDIRDNGEVFYRSPGVFVEYYKNDKSTAETKDPQGWVATGDAGFIDEKTGQLRILDRAKDVGKLANGKIFAPKYIENKLKFFPNVLEAVVFGHERESCMAFLNIDLTAVGNWAERNNVAYSSYQELSQHPQVAEILKGHVEEMNRSLAGDPMLSHCQITRFLVLHKELDADDGELTRTRKVRRNTIAERYAPLIEALYGGKDKVFAETEVTYEDGRKGKVSAMLTIHDVATAPATAAAA